MSCNHHHSPQVFIHILSYFTSHIIFHCFSLFHCCLSVVLWPEEQDFPENLHCVVYVLINKRSFEPFMCLDLILECYQSFLFSDFCKWFHTDFFLSWQGCSVMNAFDEVTS